MGGLMKVVMTVAALLALSCHPKLEDREKFKRWLKFAEVYNYLGQEDKALNYLDSLQISVRKQYSNKLPKEELLKLSEWNSRAFLERGKIYGETGCHEKAQDCFRMAITTYYGNEEGFEKLDEFSTWDPIIASTLEKIRIKEEIGNEQEAENLKKFLKKYLEVNYR